MPTVAPPLEPGPHTVVVSPTSVLPRGGKPSPGPQVTAEETEAQSRAATFPRAPGPPAEELGFKSDP